MLARDELQAEDGRKANARSELRSGEPPTRHEAETHLARMTGCSRRAAPTSGSSWDS